MRKRFNFWELILFAAPLTLLALPLLLSNWRRDKVFRADVILAKLPSLRARESCGPASCLSSSRHVAFAVMTYTQDYNDKYPLVNVNPAAGPGAPYGWADALQPYLKSTVPYHCPQDRSPASRNPTTAGYTDYWYNGNLAGVALGAVAQPAATVLASEGNDGVDVTDARYSKASFPSQWLRHTTQPPWRHLTDEVWASGGLNFVYADGHVKRRQAHELPDAPEEPNILAIR